MNNKHFTLSLNKIWSQVHPRPFIRDTITVTFLSTIGKGVGFLIPFFIAAWFGVTSQTDAFFLAYGLILFLSGIFAPVVESIIVPYIAEARAKNEDAGCFVGQVLGVSGVGLLILAGLFLLVIRPFLSVVTPFDPSSLNLVYLLLVETAPLVILLVWTSVLTGTLNAHKKFALPALSPAFRAVINLAIIFSLQDTLGVHAIAWGYVIGEFFRLLILLSFVHKFHLFSISFSLKLSVKLRELLRTASYQALGMVIMGSNLIVDKMMASWLSPGSVSILQYADRLYIIPVTFLSGGFMVTLLSYWSGSYYGNNKSRRKEQLRNSVVRAVKYIGLISVIILIGLVLLRRPIVSLVYGHGAFPKGQLESVTRVWLCYLVGFVFYMMAQVFVRLCLVLKNTKLLLRLSVLWNVLNIIFNLILMYFLKTAGIALSTSFVYIIAFFILMFLFNKEIIYKGGQDISGIRLWRMGRDTTQD